ncbi:MAG TPA: energy-coupling factor ABC transporter permease [Anaerolineales bacterium]|nr:energy-coupling factor ABC transporter permease [Anaerolineales bacterium]
MHYSPAPLHIPDGFLSFAVSIICWVITAITLSLAISRSNRSLGERQVPLMGVMAAFIFAAQMINFPVAGGTSGHLLGGALAAITLGPWAGMLVMTAVIAVQALLFQDGGLLVMGANIFNMGLITVAIGYGLYRSVTRGNRTLKLTVAGIAAWLSVMAGALFTSLQLWLSGTSQLQIVIPAMLTVHALIGVGEALITVAALTFILQTRPDLIGENSASATGSRGWILAGVLISLAVVLLSPLASADPDGLERVAGDLGFLSKGASAPFQFIPDYTLPFLGETQLSTILAGMIGLAVVGAIIVLLGQGLKAKS